MRVTLVPAHFCVWQARLENTNRLSALALPDRGVLCHLPAWTRRHRSVVILSFNRHCTASPSLLILSSTYSPPTQALLQPPWQATITMSMRDVVWNLRSIYEV